ncbi:MAG: Mut7-C RNAse domain-containing protein [Syntrophorhabdaceae bacterium]
MIFICDAMLGKLARYLRVLGLDAPYARQGSDKNVLLKLPQDAIFFTKNRVGTGFAHTIIIYNNDPHEQIVEIKKHIEPYINASQIMTRCLECNTRLESSPKRDIEPFVPEYVFHHYDNFKTCPSCRKVYWEGSHADDMHSWIQQFMDVRGTSDG